MNEYGAVPPLAVIVWLYAEFCVPLGSEAGESAMVGQETAIEYDATPVQLLASVAVTSKLDVPAAVGVPVIAPPAVSVRPVGREPLDTAKVYGPVPPLAEI